MGHGEPKCPDVRLSTAPKFTAWKMVAVHSRPCIRPTDPL